MKKSLKGSKTLVNLMKSFAGESQASMRYKYYAKQAEKEKYIQIRDIFLETSRNEDQHAKRFYRFLNQQSDAETVEITDSFPVHLDEKDTYTNLIAAAEGEHHETSSMYPEFEKIAREEGYDEIADVFREVGEVEEAHEKRYRKLAENIKEGTVFKKRPCSSLEMLELRLCS